VKEWLKLVLNYRSYPKNKTGVRFLDHPVGLILNGSQLDAGSLIQAERNKKALKRIQKKMMHARSTLNWSQSNNISCKVIRSETTDQQRVSRSESRDY